MASDYQPTPGDIQWTKQFMQALRVGGFWGTTYCTYFKKDSTTLEVIIYNLLDDNCISNIERDKNVFKASGFEIVDGHTAPN